MAAIQSQLGTQPSGQKEPSQTAWLISSPLHNKLAVEDRPFHAWYRFVLSYPPHLVRTYLSDFNLSPSATILDPFCGTGTTLVEAKKNGLNSIGVEPNPIAILASRVKCDWTPNPDSLRKAAEMIASKLEQEFRLDCIQKGSTVFEQKSLFGLQSLAESAYSLLLSGSISSIPLHKCLRLKQEILHAPEPIQRHLQLSLAWTIVNTAGNIRFGPEVGITPPKLDANVFEDWSAQVFRMADDLENWTLPRSATSNVIVGDARSPIEQLESQSIDAVITSPPYPNEKDYTRTTRLESVILGLIQNRSELKELKQSLVRSNTRNVYVSDRDDFHIESIPEIHRIAAEIEARRIELGKTSGFEKMYHRVTKLYFGGMAMHLQEMKRVLKPGAYLAYVVGDQASYLRILIRTGDLLCEIAESLGYKVVRTDLFRTRFASVTKEQMREEVVIFQWCGDK